MQQQLRAYTTQGGRLLVSGAYVGSDMTGDDERAFLSEVLKVECLGKNRDTSSDIGGLGLHFDIYRQHNEQHYAAPCTDVLMPANSQQAFPAMVYNNQTSAAVAYQGDDYRTFTMGFPFECICDKDIRQAIMTAIIKFLLE